MYPASAFTKINYYYILPSRNCPTPCALRTDH